MEAAIKRKMNRLSNLIILMCFVAMILIARMNNPIQCDCIKVEIVSVKTQMAANHKIKQQDHAY